MKIVFRGALAAATVALAVSIIPATARQGIQTNAVSPTSVETQKRPHLNGIASRANDNRSDTRFAFAAPPDDLRPQINGVASRANDNRLDTRFALAAPPDDLRPQINGVASRANDNRSDTRSAFAAPPDDLRPQIIYV